MKRKLILPLFGLLLLCSCAEKGEYSDWQGPKRDGIYPETGLLKQWPYEGPALLWSYEELGLGHAAVAVSDDKVYLTGIKDSAKSMGTLFVLDTKCNLLWEKDYGKDFTNNFIGTRSTPVVVDEGTKAQVVWRDRKFRNLLGGLRSREHWARPVIHQGILYIRHGEALMAYDIKDSKINID